MNLLLHAANAITFYFVARRLLAAARDGGSQAGRGGCGVTWDGAVAALVFAIHPLRVESVAWVTERPDVLSGFFFLTAVLAYLHVVESGDRPARRWLAGSTRGTILAARQDDRGAEAAFRGAMRLAPERLGAAANLGAIYARNRRYAEAMPLLRAAWAKQPDIPWRRTNLGVALQDQGIVLAKSGRLAEAVALFEGAVTVTPDDADLHRNLGLALWQEGRLDAAGPHLERAAALKPGDDNTRGLLALFRAQSKPPAPR